VEIPCTYNPVIMHETIGELRLCPHCKARVAKVDQGWRNEQVITPVLAALILHEEPPHPVGASTMKPEAPINPASPETIKAPEPELPKRPDTVTQPTPTEESVQQEIADGKV